MNILLVSQCSKNALSETRRILDQFAERKGDRTWATAITFDGLTTLRKLLKKTARRNTAVACHWLKSGSQNELLWIVGDASKFNEQGSVPTNSTERDILRRNDEIQWHTGEVIALLASLAGLFHDFGKANALFQKKLQGKSSLWSEPYRHEWVSLRLFQAFVDGRSDHEWLTALSAVTTENELCLLGAMPRYKDKSKDEGGNPFIGLAPLAQVVGWLIVSHHKLPEFCVRKDSPVDEPSIDERFSLGIPRFNASWISPQCCDDDWKAEHWQSVWTFPQGTPMASRTWCIKAQQIAQRAMKCNALWQSNSHWIEDRFTSHLARLSLMLADHAYSAGGVNDKWQDLQYQAYANTDRATGKCKQRLDEHNIGVGKNALLLARRLPLLKQHLPSITRHRGFKRRSKSEIYRWQDKAFELAVGVSEKTRSHGFFGVNMASTGCGKTFANARIMYGLADEKLGCRFSVALGLRTLTLQTGDALQSRLHLDSDDLAVLIGSSSVAQLHELKREDQEKLAVLSTGSDSAEPLLNELEHVRYEGRLDDGPLSHWLKQSDRVHKLISAPVLVCTIDHLIPATEGARGGRQIAPMLRLLTSDLVLDEPDDFDLADLPALCRLVNWAGVLGSRVLLSSATLPPALVCALFDAYHAGRKHYDKACGVPGVSPQTCCAWFDEFGCVQSLNASRAEYKQAHKQFVSQRIERLQKSENALLRKAALLPVNVKNCQTQEVVAGMANAIYQGIWQLHHAHHQRHSLTKKCVSIGLIRMANIGQIIAVSQQLLSMAPPLDTKVHFCIYHSQHPMLVRSRMEAGLDKALTRYDTEALWALPEIKSALSQPETHHVFIVVASPVAEVGRDHDYDWAIAEPSSMRSLIQLAGRIQRHRKQLPSSENMLILNRNFRALRAKDAASPAFLRPGFEAENNPDFQLVVHDMESVLLPAQYQFISANPRIASPDNPSQKHNLVALEHLHLAARLFGYAGIPNYAALWWNFLPDWSAEMQRRTRFRKSRPDESFVLYQEDEGEKAMFCRQGERGELFPVEGSDFVRDVFTPATGVEPWFHNDPEALVSELADRMERDLGWVSKRFTEIRLDAPKGNNVRKWHYHPWFGVYDVLV